MSNLLPSLPFPPLPAAPTVSVAITSFNYGRFLVECLDSCQAQTRVPDQIVVVDDGSTDHTPDALATYVARFPGLNLCVLRQPNAGMSAATNAAVAACTGDIVLLLDADDLMVSTRVEQVVQALQAPVQGQMPGWVHHRLQRFSDTHADLGSTPLYPEGAPEGRLGDDLLARGESVVFTPTSGLAFRRALLTAIGPLDTHRGMAQDMQLWLAAPLLSPGAWIPHALSRYRMHGQSDSSGGMLSSLSQVQVMIDRHERLATWLLGQLERHQPQAAHRWRPVTAQGSYQWLKFLERWWSGGGKDYPLLLRLLRHPDARKASLQQRLYLYAGLTLPQSAFRGLSRLLFGASPIKATVRRLLGRR